MLPLGFMVSFKIDTKNYCENKKVPGYPPTSCACVGGWGSYNKKILKANLLALKKTFVAVAGPLTNIIIILIVFLLKRDEIFNIKTDLIIYSNILIFIFNIFPIYPLDGGRILKNILHIFLGKITSLKITNYVSNIFAILLSITTVYICYITKNILYMFMLIYVWAILIRENNVYKMKIKMYKILKNYLAINQD